MKRPHRRTHFLVWLLVAPVFMAAAILIGLMRPAIPLTALPAGIEGVSNTAGQR